MFLFIYILIGLFLGPSFLQVTLPEIFFSIGAFGFLFVAGLELDLFKLRQEFALSARVASGAFALPFVAGFIYAFFLLGRDAHGSSVVAVALAISALPVVVQILKDLKIYETRMGHVIVASATLCDVLAWLIFTVMIPGEDRGRWILSHLPVLFFFFGLGISGWVRQRESLHKFTLWSSKLFFGPLFFIGVGMKIHLQKSFDLNQALVIFALATVAKMAGVYWSGRLAKFTRSESKLMAVVLNARGAMEILFCSIALKLGMIDDTLFTSLTLMAVLSSLMAAPLVKILQRKSLKDLIVNSR